MKKSNLSYEKKIKLYAGNSENLAVLVSQEIERQWKSDKCGQSAGKTRISYYSLEVTIRKL